MAVSEVTALTHGEALKIFFTDGVFVQVNEAFEDFKLLKRFKVDSAASVGSRQINWEIVSDLGIGAVGFPNVGRSGSDFIAAQQSSSSEKTAYLRELQATVEVEEGLVSRALKSREQRYFEPLELEAKLKRLGMMKRLAFALYQGGIGVIGEISSVNVNSAVANQAVVTLQQTDTDIGFVGGFELNDRVVHKAAAGTAGTAPTISAGTFDYWLVKNKDRDAGTVTLAPVNTLGTTVNVSAWAPAAGEAIYPDSQGTFPNTGSVTDWGTETDNIVGLESWSADDSRTVFGVAMTGATKGSRYSASGSPIDPKHLQRGISRAKNTAGEGLYKYSMLQMAPETEDALIEGREADRYFASVGDKSRGISGRFSYRHRGDALEVYSSEYVPSKRIYSVPQDVLQFHSTDIEPIKAQNGDILHLKPSANGGHVNMFDMYLRGFMQIVCVKPSAIMCVHDFLNS